MGERSEVANGGRALAYLPPAAGDVQGSSASGDPPCLFERKPHRTCKFKVALLGAAGDEIIGTCAIGRAGAFGDGV